MATVYQAALAWRRRLAQLDQQAAQQITRHYTQAAEAIQPHLDAVTEQIQAEQASGEPATVLWLFQQQRYQTLLAMIGLEIDQFARQTGQVVSQAQREAIGYALEAARDLVTLQLPPGLRGLWAGVNPVAVESIIGATTHGPLWQLLASFRTQAQSLAQDALVEAVILEENPNHAAERLQAALATSEWRARLIARTELHRAHRTATSEAYQHNAHIVQSWVWLSALSTRTCPACWAMHGTVHPITEQLHSHPNCRCTMVPRTVDWADLPGAKPGQFDGVHDTRPDIEAGADVFERLPVVEQETILGPLAYRAWRAGEVTLGDLVGYRDDPQWGPTRWTRSLRSLGVTVS